MNKILLILCLVLLTSCSPKEVPIDLLVEMQGIKYEVNSHTPFTGISFENYENGKSQTKANYKDGKLQSKENYKDGKLEYKQNYKDGKADGLWEYYFSDGRVKK